MALLGVGPRLLLCALCQLLFEAGGQAEYPLGALAELPLAMRRGTEAKRRRLAAIAGLGGISDTALVKVSEPELRMAPQCASKALLYFCIVQVRHRRRMVLQ